MNRYVIDSKIPPIAVLVLGFFMAFLLTGVSLGQSQSISDDASFDPPYDQYTLTQGLHGYSYGHMAIDIAAGKGAVIKSPINGKVTGKFIDGVGNTAIEIENSFYKVTLLHGEYSVDIGNYVRIGQPIGVESNIGNTTDMQGVSCKNRDCGYHTHLNVFSKKENQNINPLLLLEQQD